ncbi:hypothetical protein KJS94_02200 [Flavihumibacter rivuli]|uniref:hypothetical protein n=1 Tax=Flavihumibacter rivuli TaxID=2838156 RepID=UPI001BDDE29A|nr:hypothetical protein [Flavihumibacter rivuli]ULQ57007.1 hypothetical protein KJS94_02200 [Flavihumibacter rivuli]
MRNIFICSLLALFLFSSCSKDNDEPSYFLTCKIDGVEKSFNVGAYASYVKVENIELWGMGGFENRNDDSPTMGLYLSNQPSEKPLGSTGTFNSTNTDWEVLSTYMAKEMTEEYSAGSSVNADAEFYGVTIQDPLVLTITSNDGKTLEGTFSGDHYLDSDPKATRRKITEGKFRLKIIKE